MAEQPDEIKCLVLSLTGRPVIVPNSAVAEIITQQDIDPVDGGPDWLLGTGWWRGTRIPLVALDRLLGERGDVPEPGGRYVVLFGLEANGAPGFYGVRIDSLPRTEMLGRDQLRPAEGGASASEYVQQCAIIDGERECLIPDFEGLGSLLGQYARADPS